MRVLGLAVFACCLIPSPAQAQGESGRKTLTFDGAERTVLVHVPKNAAPDTKRALIITLHGDGGNAAGLVDAWRRTADREGILLMGPISKSGRGWDVGTDGPDFFEAVVNLAINEYGADPRRVYLFGHSAGAHFALMMSVLEPEYFAAAVAHAGVLYPELDRYARLAERKIPILLFAGKRDPIVPLAHVKDTHARLTALGWNITLHETDNDHAYVRIADTVNRMSWEMLKNQRLDAEPKFRRYQKR
jgi:poly(3-hydroxybutyrate) depolymerase